MSISGGIVYLMCYPYGYRVQTHFFSKAGYTTDIIFPIEKESAAVRFYRAECKKYGKEPNI